MYYICKFSDTWSVYDTNKRSSRNLDGTEIGCIKSLFPDLLDDSKILVALQVNSINPNKLLQLPANDTLDVHKKITGKVEPKTHQEKTT